MIVRFSPLALRRMKFIGSWWRKNRPATATLFDDELDDVEKIASQPLLGVVHEVVADRTFRRILLRKTKQRVFYFIDDAKGVIVVHTIWGARRGRGPKL